MSGCFGSSNEDQYFENLSLVEPDFDFVVFEVKGSEEQVFDFEIELNRRLNEFEGTEVDIDSDKDVVKFEIFTPNDTLSKVRDLVDILTYEYKLELI